MLGFRLCRERPLGKEELDVESDTSGAATSGKDSDSKVKGPAPEPSGKTASETTNPALVFLADKDVFLWDNAFLPQVLEHRLLREAIGQPSLPVWESISSRQSLPPGARRCCMCSRHSLTSLRANWGVEFQPSLQSASHSIHVFL